VVRACRRVVPAEVCGRGSVPAQPRARYRLRGAWQSPSTANPRHVRQRKVGGEFTCVGLCMSAERVAAGEGASILVRERRCGGASRAWCLAARPVRLGANQTGAMGGGGALLAHVVVWIGVHSGVRRRECLPHLKAGVCPPGSKDTISRRQRWGAGVVCRGCHTAWPVSRSG